MSVYSEDWEECFLYKPKLGQKPSVIVFFNFFIINSVIFDY